MIVDYKDHYSQEYWEQRKTYQTPDGRVHQYTGPSLAWEGFGPIAKAIATVLPPRKFPRLLDIGCGGGDLCRYLLECGFDAHGVDISEHALKNVAPAMARRVALCDVTSCPSELAAYPPRTRNPEMGADGVLTGTPVTLPSTYDVVMSTDFLEHVYEVDLDRTLAWLIERTRPGGHLFFCVAIVDADKYEFVHTKGAPVPLEHQGTAVSGHVNVRTWRYWLKKFRDYGLEPDWPRMWLFACERDRDDGWRNTAGWSTPTTWILKRA